VSSKYRHLYQFCYAKIFSNNYNRNLVLLDDPGRVRSQIATVVCQIQRFDFDCNLELARKLIIRIPAGLGLNPLYVRRQQPKGSARSMCSDPMRGWVGGLRDNESISVNGSSVHRFFFL
jgi:hypothetical protein